MKPWFVQPTTLFHSFLINGHDAVTKPKRLKSITCQHLQVGDFTYIDHTAGPGCFADNYVGEYCIDCNKIMHMQLEGQTGTPRHESWKCFWLQPKDIEIVAFDRGAVAKVRQCPVCKRVYSSEV